MTTELGNVVMDNCSRTPGVVCTHLLSIDDLPAVFNCLETLQDRCKRVGDCLGIKAYRIDAIEKNERTCEDKLREIIADWLKGGATRRSSSEASGHDDHNGGLQCRPSWKSLSEAIQPIDENKASSIIRDHQCSCDECFEITGIRNTPVGRSMRQGETIEAAYALSDEFDKLMTQAGNFIKSHIDIIKAFVISYMKHNVDNLPLSSEIEQYLKKIDKFKAPKAIIKFLTSNHFVNYLSHGLLKKLLTGASPVDCPFLQDGEYQKDLTCFLHSRLSSFPDIFEQLEIHPPKGLPSFVIHLGSNWMNKSMHELIETLQKNLTISFDNLILVNVIRQTQHDSLDVVFAIWPCFVLSFVTDFSKFSDVLKATGATIELSKNLELIITFNGQPIIVETSQEKIKPDMVQAINQFEDHKQMTSLIEPCHDVNELVLESLTDFTIENIEDTNKTSLIDSANEDKISCHVATFSDSQIEKKSYVHVDSYYSLQILSPTSVRILFKTSNAALSHIAKFEVKYSDTNGKIKSHEVNLSMTSSITLGNLNPQKAYTFYIKAFSVIGECIDYQPLSFNPLCGSVVSDPPGKPLAYSISHANAIKLTWKPPKQYSIVKSYQIFYKPMESDDHQWQSIENLSHSNEFIFHSSALSRRSSIKYVFKVAAICTDGVSDDSETSDPIMMLSSSSSQGNSTKNIKGAATSVTSVELWWMPPPRTIDAPTTNYLISYRAGDGNSNRKNKHLFKSEGGIGGTCTEMLITDRIIENALSFKWKKTSSSNEEKLIEDAMKEPFRQHSNSGSKTRGTIIHNTKQCESDSQGVLLLKWQDHKPESSIRCKIEIDEKGRQTAPVNISIDSSKMQIQPINVKHNTKYKIRVLPSSTEDFTAAHSKLFPEKPYLLKRLPTHQSNQISIKWTEQENISFYKVFCYSPLGSIDSISTTNNWCTFTNLAPKTLYSFGVQAVNSYGKSEEVVSDDFYTTTFMSASPQFFSAKEVHMNSVTLQWEVPEHDAVAFEHYSIQYRRAGTDDDWQCIDDAIHQVYYTVQDLTEHTSYIFQVCAHFGESQVSERAKLHVKTKPIPPGKPEYKILENGDIKISWAKPQNKKPNQEYQLFCENSVGTTTCMEQSIIKNSTIVKRYHFHPEEIYVFRVKSVCNDDISDNSECSDQLSIKRPPQVFGKPRPIACTARSIHLKWNAAKPHFETIHYKVMYSKRHSSSKNWQSIEANKTESIWINDLTPNTSYIFKVKAKHLVSDNYEGSDITSEHSDPIKTTPPPPTNLQPNIHALKSIKLNWNAPEALSSYVSFYKVHLSSSKALEHWFYYHKKFETTEAIIDADLSIGMQYCFKVVAVFAEETGMNDSESEPSKWIEIIYPIPGPPDKIISSNITQDSILLKWDKPSVNGEYVKSYTIYVYEKPNNGEILDEVASQQEEFKVIGLTPDTSYQFRIKAINSDGQGGETESNVIKTDRKAPGPPGKPYMLRVTHNMVKVSWKKPMKHAEMVFQYQVFYKKHHDDSEWLYEKTQSDDTEIEIHELDHSTQYVFKVRPLIRDGYFDKNSTSEISELIEMKSALPSEPGKPKGEADASGSITLSWARPEENFKDISHYEIMYYEAEEGQSKSRVNSSVIVIKTDNAEEQMKIKSLSPNQGYYFSVRAITKSCEKSGLSLTSDLITNHKTLAAKVLPFCEQICEKSEKIPIYLLPRGDSSCLNDTLRIFEHRLTNQSLSPSSARKSQVNKVLMLVGATGAGKSTLINAMINYIMRVEYGNHFRLKLIHEPDVLQTKSVTKFVTAYEIRYESGFAIPYTLTIIDTPGFGDTAGLERDREITKQIKAFFSIEDGITRLDGIGFVCQSSSVRLTPTQQYIFDSILAIFGNDVKNNIFVLCTFCDGDEPRVLKAMEEVNIPADKHYKFNNSAVYSANSAVNKVTESFWEMGVESFKEFFDQLNKTESVGIRRTKDVLQQRENLENCAIELKQKIQQGMEMIKDLKRDTQALKKMEDNHAHEVEVETKDAILNVDLDKKGERANNCIKCQITCHHPCRYDVNRKGCAVMKKQGGKMYCSVCPGLCYWSDHKLCTYRIERRKEVVKKTFKSISEKHPNTIDSKNTSIKEAIDGLKNMIDEKFDEILQLVLEAKECNKELDDIALLPNHLNNAQYIDMLIETQKTEKCQGYEERIEHYHMLKQRIEIFEESGTFSLRRDTEGKRWWEKYFQDL